MRALSFSLSVALFLRWTELNIIVLDDEGLEITLCISISVFHVGNSRLLLLMCISIVVAPICNILKANFVEPYPTFDNELGLLHIIHKMEIRAISA